MYAVHLRNRGRVYLLLAHDADATVEIGRQGMTALHVAALAGDLPIAKMLMQANPSVAWVKDDLGRTPEDIALATASHWPDERHQEVADLVCTRTYEEEDPLAEAEEHCQFLQQFR